MTYGELKHKVLKLIFSDTIAGDEIAMTYNNQADYVLAIPGLVNDCQTYIATGRKRIPALVQLADLEKEELEAFDVYHLPADCWQMMNGGLIMPHGNHPHRHFVADRYRGYRLYGGDKLLVPKGMDNRLLLEYWKYPAPLSEDVDDDFVLENSEDVNECIPYYVAAHLVLYDDAYRYTALYSEFETRYARLREPVIVEEGEIRDAYAGFDWCYF